MFLDLSLRTAVSGSQLVDLGARVEAKDDFGSILEPNFWPILGSFLGSF